ncbi:MAG: glutaredoxin [Planctomycetes bacterium]|nr:glutaredoxin [Planctomycetota bacterium]
MKVHVYSKEGCGICTAAKEKLQRMGYDYEEHNLQYHVEFHEGWEKDGSIEILAAHSQINTMPLIRVGNEFLDYAAAMKTLKSLRKQEGQRVTA